MLAKDERRWALWFGLGLMALTTLPYLAGYFAQTPEWRYTGLVMAEEDGFSYFAKMLSGAHGAWLFRTPYTLQDQRGFLAFLPYLLLGKLTSAPGQHEQIVALFHLFRIAGGVLATLATYRFAAVFLSDVRWRRLATALTMIGGGLGWLSLVGLSDLWQGPMPLEFYSPETFGFLGWLVIPHLAWERALLLWGLAAYLSGRDVRSGAWAGLLWLAMGLFQPLTVAVAWVVLGAHVTAMGLWVWRNPTRDWTGWRRWLLRAALAGLLSAPAVFYNLVSFHVDPFLGLWEQQNYLPSPPIGDYLLGYAVALPLLALGVRAAWRMMDDKRLFLLAWLVVLPLLAYLPNNLQRRLPEGSWVAISVLVALGFAQLRPAWRRLATGWVSLSFVPALVLVWVAFHSATWLLEPSFQPIGELRAFQFFDGLTDERPAVLAAEATSTVLPAYEPVRVPIGHGPESIGAAQLKPRVAAFYAADASASERLALLQELGIDYVFWGPGERALGAFDPGVMEGLAPVYQEEGYAIYRVQADLAH